MQLQSEVAGRCSQALQCGLDIGIGRVDENGNDVRGGDQLVQQLQSLRSELHVQSNHAREIASRSAEGSDQTKLDRVAAGIEHDRNRSGCCPCREHRSSVRRDNDGHLTTNQFGRHPWQPIISANRPAVFDRHVSALDIARLLQALTECIQHGPVCVWRLAYDSRVEYDIPGVIAWIVSSSAVSGGSLVSEPSSSPAMVGPNALPAKHDKKFKIV